MQVEFKLIYDDGPEIATPWILCDDKGEILGSGQYEMAAVKSALDGIAEAIVAAEIIKATP